jgi:hypothetical protein
MSWSFDQAAGSSDWMSESFDYAPEILIAALGVLIGRLRF